MPKMVVTTVFTMTNNNEQRTMNYSKQTQSNPILSASGGFKRHTCSGKWCAEHTLPSEPFGEFAYLNFPERIELKKWIRKIIWKALPKPPEFDLSATGQMSRPHAQ